MIKTTFKFIKYILIILLLIFFVTFCIANDEMVTISLSPFPFEADIKLFLLIIFSILLGILISYFLKSINSFGKLIKSIKEKAKTKKLDKKIENLEKENVDLKKGGSKND